MNYKNDDIEIIDGRIPTPSLEVHIVDHCNLRCAECCSLSPLLPEHYVKPEDMRHDLELATRVVKPTYLKLVGGEPLLHPNIIECLQSARPFADILSVTTNAILLEKMNDEFWTLIDALTISIYPTPKLHQKTLDYIHNKARIFDVSLNIKHQSNFVVMNRWNETADAEITKDIYLNCWLRERCHIVDKGRFYQCTRPPHLDTFFKGKKDYHQDGILLHKDASLLEEIFQYLKRSEPLESCYKCKGGSAEEQPHRMQTSKELIQLLELQNE